MHSVSLKQYAVQDLPHCLIAHRGQPPRVLRLRSCSVSRLLTRELQSPAALQDENGEKTSWAGWHAVPNDQLYGPEGWCGAKEPARRCETSSLVSVPGTD